MRWQVINYTYSVTASPSILCPYIIIAVLVTYNCRSKASYPSTSHADTPPPHHSSRALTDDSEHNSNKFYLVYACICNHLNRVCCYLQTKSYLVYFISWSLLQLILKSKYTRYWLCNQKLLYRQYINKNSCVCVSSTDTHTHKRENPAYT